MIPGGVPTDQKKLLAFANDLIEQCRVSVGMRSSYYRLMNAIAETGRYDGTKSLINMMYGHLVRTAAVIYSPVELKFSVDFENPQPKYVMDRGAQIAKVLSRSWERNNTDIMFGRGVFEALKYGATFLKQWVELKGKEQMPTYCRRLVMPWQFGVYREDLNELDLQSALCETTTLTIPEVWQRIWMLPNADKLLSRIRAHSSHGESGSDPQSFFHQVLSTSQLSTGVQGMTRPVPGGIVQMNNDPNYSIMGPVIAAETVQMHELWVQDEEDYVTIQMIEPDIIISPLYKRANLLINESNKHPYTIIQPNEVTNWMWGRSELVDLIEPQGLLSTWCDDVKRLFGLQVDKLIAFVGESGVTDEMYAQFRAAGYINMGQGASANDLTPNMPPEAIAMLEFVMKIINTLGGFPEIMQGKGEAGVRAGSHADTLLSTGSAPLQDRALLVERQCAIAGDLTLTLKEAKDPNHYWLKADDPVKDVEETKFLISDLPDDWRVTVDSHSSSPIFRDKASQLIFAALKAGIVTGEYVLDNEPFPNKEAAKAQLREKEKANAAFMKQIMEQFPELGEKILAKKAVAGAGHR